MFCRSRKKENMCAKKSCRKSRNRMLIDDDHLCRSLTIQPWILIINCTGPCIYLSLWRQNRNMNFIIPELVFYLIDETMMWVLPYNQSRINKRSWKRINIELCRSRYEFILNTFERIYIHCGSKVSSHFFVLSRVLKIHKINSIQKISWIWNTIRKKNDI